MAEKSVSNVLKSIEESKNRSLTRVFFALGITHVGGQYADLLSDRFDSIDDLHKVGQEELSLIPSIGPKIAESIVAFFRQEGNKKIIEKLRKAGVKLEKEKTKQAKSEELPLFRLEFVLTGKLDSFSRSEAEARIKSLGGKASSDVSKKTSYVVVGTDPGSKLAKAEKLEVEILRETEFLRLLDKAARAVQEIY
jgi:DNA ligase (NAD+)